MLALTRVVMKPGRLADEHGLLPHPPRHRFDRLERRRRAFERLHDLDQLHLVDRVEEVHAGHARRVLQRAGHLGDAERRRVGSPRSRRRRERSICGEQRSFRSMRSGAASMTKSASAERLRQARGRREPRQHGVGIGRRHLAELDALLDDASIAAAPLVAAASRHVVQARFVPAGDRGVRDAMPHRAGPEHLLLSRKLFRPSSALASLAISVDDGRPASPSRDRSPLRYCRNAAPCGCRRRDGSR